MAKKNLGYVELEWVCPYCNGRNPGTHTKCGNCGAPQPEDVQFHQKAQETIITDKEKIKQAKAGPDIHCAYCGTRNPATNTTCIQCGSDLSEGEARQTGQILGKHQHRPAANIVCSYCGATNPANALTCAQCSATLERPPTKPKPTSRPKTRPKAKSSPTNPLLIGIGIFALLSLCGLIALFFRTEETVGQVDSVNWTRSILIEELGPVTYETWRDEIPSGAPIGSCSERVHHTQDSPTANSREVCGEPYTVDTGTGVGEVVQDCEYKVYEDWCSYTVEEWQELTTVSSNGTGFSPYWPDPSLRLNQRESEREEDYRVVFNNDGQTYTYNTSNYNEFTQYEIGSRWSLQVNTFDQVFSTEPLD